MKMPNSVSLKKNVKASNGRVEPIQANLFGRRSTLGRNASACCARMRELMPSAATTRSALRVRLDLGLEFQLDAERAGALLQQPQQRDPRTAAKAVAADAMHGAFEVDLDVVPVGEIVGDRPVALWVVLLEGLQRLVREHDAEAERVVRAVALEDGEPHLRPGLLGQDREIKPRRAAADDIDLHVCPLHREMRITLSLK